MRTRYCRPLVEHFNLVVRESLAVKTFQSVHFGSDVVAQCGPVECGSFRVPSKTACIRQIFGKMRAIDQQLFRYTAANDTGPTDAIFLRDGYARTMRCRYTCSTKTTRTGTDNEEIIVKVRHGKFLSVHETMWGVGRIVTNC